MVETGSQYDRGAKEKNKTKEDAIVEKERNKRPDKPQVIMDQNKAQIVIGDKSHFSFKGNNQSGNRAFYSVTIDGSDDDVRYATGGKFTLKVWMTFS